MDIATHTTTVSSAAPLVTTPLTAADRCDWCDAQAYVRATLPAGAELLFCGHHAHAYRPALAAQGAQFHDETDKLTIPQVSGFSA